MHSYRSPVRFGLILALFGGSVLGLPPSAVAAPAGPKDRSVPVSPVRGEVPPLPEMAKHTPRKVTWPTAGTAVVEVASSKAGMRAVVGGLPVTLSPVDSGASALGSASAQAFPAPDRVSVTVLDQRTSLSAGAPVALRVSRVDGGSGGKFRLALDTSAFRDGYGGAWLARLQLMVVPECGLTAVSAEQARLVACAPVPVETSVNFKSGVVSGDIDFGVPLAGLGRTPSSPKRQALDRDEAPDAAPAVVNGSRGMIVMMTSGSQAQGVGTFGKTDLKESGTWAHGGASGEFSYSYPLGTPPVPGGLSPKLSLNYSSATVDGQTAAEHLQNGPLGEGWSVAGAGFIETTFRPCSQDNSTDHPANWTNATGDPCFRHENAQLSWSGRSGELVPSATANQWNVAADDGARVEFIPQGNEGHWRVMATDGTQWYFGLQRLPGWSPGARETNSRLTVEMFANHSGEPCYHASGYTSSHCTKPYRWLLDYAVDANGNSMSYWYNRYTNLAGSNNSASSVFSYDRDAVLDHIEYGTRSGYETTATPPAKVVFTNSDRCLASCGTEAAPTTANWPDVPFDQRCTAAPCTNNLSPSYWTTKRLTKVTTSVWTGTGTTYLPVDEWSFGQSFPGGTDVPTLWLDSITRKGYDNAGGSTTMPSLTTHGRIDRNRADYDPGASMADPQKYRIDYLDNETGGRIEVSYLPANEPACTWWSGKLASEWPNYNHNASRCFMQWVTNRSGAQGWSWWHKFVVDKITENDMVSDTPDKVTSYQYTMDGASSSPGGVVLWGYATSVWPSPKKAMSAWKGYPTVITTVGAAGGTQTKTKRVYYRRLDRDTGLDPAQNFFRDAYVVDSTAASVDDHQAFAGQVREEIVYDGATEISKTIHTHAVVSTSAGGALPAWQTPPERYAYKTGETSTKVYTKVAGGTWRIAQTDNVYDTTYGTLTETSDLGQVSPALATDDRCVAYTHNRNTTQNLAWLAGTGTGLSTIPRLARNDWSIYDQTTSADFNGDGKADVIARSPADAKLWFIAGNGDGTLSPFRTLIGTSWIASNYDAIFAAGDLNSDGKMDIVTRTRDTSELWMYAGLATVPWVRGP